MEPSYVVMPIYKIGIKLEEVPDKVKKVLKEFESVMPEQLPKVLPLRRLVAHEIELLSGVKPPAKASYRMALPNVLPQTSPFEVVTGQLPRLPHTSLESYGGKNPRAFNLSKEWRQNTKIAQAYLKKASKIMKKWANKGRRVLKEARSRLVRKYKSPVKILSKIGNAYYKIDPPKWMKVHPVFHVSNLKPFLADPTNASHRESTRAAIIIKLPSEHQVEEILADRVSRISRRIIHEYLVKWESLGPKKTN
ncbi:uncharacterized protein LOC111306539 [Durio zibethinus]|uniref:Uncharacterized protein LOC111306539 n=1 Tax=Durio zibethinus TaxID=66656 RepID=A0A6P6A5U7_DURZI|nr:uncharacterized protein LOC111306539 [Durio zibethinus]